MSRPLGYGSKRCHKIRHVVGFDPLTFSQVRASAEELGVPFSERARQLVEAGLEYELEEATREQATD